MLNNLVNADDLARCVGKVRRREYGDILAKLKGSAKTRVKNCWDCIDRPPIHAWDIPAVAQRWERLMSGDSDNDYCHYVVDEYLGGLRPAHAIAVACGTGERELRWAETGGFERIDGYDLSDARIERARLECTARGLSGIAHFHVADVYDMDIADESQDVIIAENALHHFTPLREMIARIHRFLTPGGYLFTNEYIGPTRLRWTNRQLAAVNAVLAILPERYRRQWDGRVKQRVTPPSRATMLLKDPSEAVESEWIMPLLHEFFDVVEVRPYGGTILQPLFHEIAFNFISDSPEIERLLAIAFEIEDLLMEMGELSSDFALAVCRKRSGARTDGPRRGTWSK